MPIFGVKVPFLGVKFGSVGVNESKIVAKFLSFQGKRGGKTNYFTLNSSNNPAQVFKAHRLDSGLS